MTMEVCAHGYPTCNRTLLQGSVRCFMDKLYGFQLEEVSQLLAECHHPR